MIIWITGISGSGKTTIAQRIISKYKKHLPNLVNVDGDLVREFFGEDLQYDEVSRVKQIKRIQKICKFLEKQELILIVSALYSNPELMQWNRKHFLKYYEIYLDASIDLVKKRDPKSLYQKFREGKEKNIVGIDIPWQAPEKYNLKIKMKENTNIDDIIEEISLKISCFNDLGI
jgi:adenylylsulfate kinase-like enzyme